MANTLNAAGIEYIKHRAHSECTARSAPTRNGSAVISPVVAVVNLNCAYRRGGSL